MIRRFSKGTFWLLLWAAFLATPHYAISFAASAPCATKFAQLTTAEKRSIISQKVAVLPGLKPYIEQLINDPSVPAKLRRLLEATLARPDVTVVQLNDSLVNTYLIHRDLTAFHASTLAPDISLVERKGEALSFNAEASKLARSGRSTKGSITSRQATAPSTDFRSPYPYKRGHSVFVRDRRLSADANDLLSFVHELAHVKFDEFLKRNILLFRKNFPSYVRRSLKGGYKIDEQFYHYCTERYAHETEWAAMKATNGKYFEEYAQFLGLPVNAPEEAVRQHLSDDIAIRYGITDPRLQALGARSLQDIFRNGF